MAAGGVKDNIEKLTRDWRNFEVEFRDLKKQYEVLKLEIDAQIQCVINNTSFILGNPVKELEEALAQYTGRKYCISCGSGTDALQLALMAWGVGPGDAFFTSDFTFFASAGAGALLGATPVFVDIDSLTFNMDPDALEIQITRIIKEGKLTPKVIIPVDLFGQPANYDRILAIAKKYKLKVLEDAAQGFGGSIRGKKACSFGDVSITSFFPAKPLGCYGDGGAIFTDSEEEKDILISLRAQGKSPKDKYDNLVVGINSRLDSIQAAILLPKFKAFVDYELDAVNKVAEWYNERLKARFIIPTVIEGYKSSWAQYTVMLNDNDERNQIQAQLKEKNIPSMIYYPRGLHQQKAFEHMNIGDEQYQNTVRATKKVLSLPMHPYLTEEDVEQVCQALVKNNTEL